VSLSSSLLFQPLDSTTLPPYTPQILLWNTYFLNAQAMKDESSSKAQSPKKLKPGNLSLHPCDPTLVINYTILASNAATEVQKTLTLDTSLLTSYDDCIRMAGQLVNQYKFIHESQQSKLEQLLYQLFLRDYEDATTRVLHGTSPTCGDGTFQATIEELSTYIEMLYDDKKKAQGTENIMELARNVINLEALLLDNPTVPRALARVLMDDGSQPKNDVVIYNILWIFWMASNFYELHETLVKEHRVGSLTMQTLASLVPVLASGASVNIDQDGHSRRRFPIQSKLNMRNICRSLFVGLWLLLNLARGDALVEEKMTKKGLIQEYLLPLLHSDVQVIHTNLYILSLTFLKRLSVYEENVQHMAEDRVVARLVSCVWAELPQSNQGTATTFFGRSSDDIEVDGFPAHARGNAKERMTEAALGILYNLAFEPLLRRSIMACGLVPKLVISLKRRKPWQDQCIKLLYLLSYDGFARSQICEIKRDEEDQLTTRDAMSIVKELIFEFPLPSLKLELAALAINLTLDHDNVEILCAKAGLRRLMDRVIRHRDPLVLKIIRNVSQWSLAVQASLEDPEKEYNLRNLWPSHIKPLLAMLPALAGSASSSGGPALSSTISGSVMLPPPGSRQPTEPLVLETIGILANLTPLDLPIGMQWHDFNLASLLSQEPQQESPKSLLVYCKEAMLELQSHRDRRPDHNRVTVGDYGNEKYTVDMLLQILLLLQTLALDPVCSEQMSQDIEFLKAMHSIWCDTARIDNELALQALVLMYRLYYMSFTSSALRPGLQFHSDVLEALQHPNAEIRQVADKCVELLFKNESYETIGKVSEPASRSHELLQLRRARFQAQNPRWCIDVGFNAT
jgi:hypothetical protein